MILTWKLQTHLVVKINLNLKSDTQRKSASSPKDLFKTKQPEQPRSPFPNHKPHSIHNNERFQAHRPIDVLMLSFASKALATVNNYISPAKPKTTIQNMDLFEARLASFQAPQTTGKKRASTIKNGKAGKWSLKVPSAEQVRYTQLPPHSSNDK